MRPKALSEEISGRAWAGWGARMATRADPFRHFKSSPEVIRLAMLICVCFPILLRNVKDLLFQPGVDVCHETVGEAGRLALRPAKSARREPLRCSHQGTAGLHHSRHQAPAWQCRTAEYAGLLRTQADTRLGVCFRLIADIRRRTNGQCCATALSTRHSSHHQSRHCLCPEDPVKALVPSMLASATSRQRELSQRNKGIPDEVVRVETALIYAASCAKCSDDGHCL